jgi:hypothetical protein
MIGVAGMSFSFSDVCAWLVHVSHTTELMLRGMKW